MIWDEGERRSKEGREGKFRFHFALPLKGIVAVLKRKN